MRVHGTAEFCGGCFQSAGQASFGNQIRGAIADDMATKNLIIFLVHYQLHESFVVTCRDGLAQGAEGKFSSLHLIPARLCLFLVQADNGDLRLTINASGNTQVIDRFLPLAHHELNRGNTFLGGRMRQQGWTIYITNSIDGFASGAHPFVNLNVAAVQLHSQRLQTEPSTQGSTTHRDQDLVGGAPLHVSAVLKADFDTAGKLFYTVELGPRPYL